MTKEKPTPEESTYLRLLKGRQNIIILDTETTGTDPSQDELLQISIVGGSGELIFDRYVRPTRTNSWPDAQQVNHISPELVKDAPTIEELLPEIQRIISAADCIIGYNVCFDIDFLRWVNCDFPDWSGDNPACLIIDIMELFAAIYGDWNAYYQNYRWQPLVRAASYYQYSWEDAAAHNSLGDCFATLHVWNRMMENGDVAVAERRIRTAMEQGFP